MIDSADATKPCVLFVDDEPRVLSALKAIFRGSYRIVTADNGEAAVQLLQQQEVDVVVSDQQMPGMTGVEVLRQARKLRPRAIRVLLTGYSDLEATVAAINEGEVFRFISKPWSNEQIRATLAAAVRASTVEEPATAEAKPEVAAPTLSDSAVGVLILEPDGEVRESLRAALRADHPVHCAAAVEDGLALLGQHRIGVLITELMVDGEDLTAALGTLRQYDPSLVAVVLTSQADAVRTVNLINQSQIYRLLRKPVSDQLLRGTVNLALQRFANQLRHPQLVRRNETEAAAEPLPRAGRESMVARIKRLLLLR